MAGEEAGPPAEPEAAGRVVPVLLDAVPIAKDLQVDLGNDFEGISAGAGGRL